MVSDIYPHELQLNKVFFSISVFIFIFLSTTILFTWKYLIKEITLIFCIAIDPHWDRDVHHASSYVLLLNLQALEATYVKDYNERNIFITSKFF
jgi:hypothetical protein